MCRMSNGQLCITAKGVRAIAPVSQDVCTSVPRDVGFVDCGRADTSYAGIGNCDYELRCDQDLQKNYDLLICMGRGQVKPSSLYGIISQPP